MDPIFLAFPHIEKYSDAIKEVNYAYKEKEKDTPVIAFKGTTKLHGTNAAIGYRNLGGKEGLIWYQSRNQILKKDSADNHGFLAFASHPDIKKAVEQWCAPLLTSP